MTGPLILAIDQGTTSSRALLVRADGSIAGVGQRQLTQHFPEPGRVEHDALEIWQTTLDAIHEALDAAGHVIGEVTAIGIANQRETVLLWDRATGEPCGRAIVWQDRRTAADCERLRSAGHEPAYHHATGLTLDPYFSGTKLSWMLGNDPVLRARAEAGELAAGTIDSWLIWKLTGGQRHVTDYTNASRTLLFNIRRGRWDEALLEPLGVPRAVLPHPYPSASNFATTSEDVLGATIPICGVAGDQQAALFGQGCTPGQAKNTYGTGCFLLANSGRAAIASERRLLTSIGAGAGAGGVTFVPAFTGLGAPDWDPFARGAILGLTRGTTKAHIARAALEAIALSSAELLEAMNSDLPEPITELRVDGGASQNNLLMQLQADFAGIPVVRPAETETTALGAAYLAGLGSGVWSSVEEVRALWREDRRFEPAISSDQRRARLERWRRGVERTLNWANES